jgi:sulfur carrier protein
VDYNIICNRRLEVMPLLIRLNGERYEIEFIAHPYTINDLLQKLNISPDGVAVEVNLNIIKKINYNKVLLNEDDSVEIVNFVGGG